MGFKTFAVGLAAELLTPVFNGLAVCYCDTQLCLCHDACPVKVKNTVNIKYCLESGFMIKLNESIYLKCTIRPFMIRRLS
jgi:hypothetical protein